MLQTSGNGLKAHLLPALVGQDDSVLVLDHKVPPDVRLQGRAVDHPVQVREIHQLRQVQRPLISIYGYGRNHRNQAASLLGDIGARRQHLSCPGKRKVKPVRLVIHPRLPALHIEEHVPVGV